MSQKTQIVFILDESGSMHPLQSDTIGGFNSYIEQQKSNDVNADVTVVLFNQTCRVLYDRQSVYKIPVMKNTDYIPQGCTALLDAIGLSVKDAENNFGKNDKVLFVITTDGLENASHQYTYHDIKKMISRKSEEGWEFIFLGANIDAASEAEKIGISPQRSARYVNDSKGIKLNFRIVADASSQYACGKPIRDDWSEDIKADYSARGK